MSKERITVRLEEDKVAWIDQNYSNRSAFLRDLIDSARGGGFSATEDVVRQYQLEQLRSDLERKRAEMESTQQRIETLESLQENRRQETEDMLAEARQTLSDVPKEPDNPAILNWAEKLDMTPEELIDNL